MVKTNNLKSIALVILLMFSIINDVITLVEGGGSAFNGIILALCEFTLLMSLFSMVHSRVKSTGYLLVSQVLTFIYELLDGATVNEAMNDIGIIGILSVIVFILYVVLTGSREEVTLNGMNMYKVPFSGNESKLEQAKEIIYRAFTKERKLYKINFVTRIILYSLMVTIVMSLSKSEALNTLNNDSLFRIYGSLALLLPLFMVILIIIDCKLAYDVFLFKIIMEIITIVEMSKMGTLTLNMVASLMIEVTFFLLIITELLLENKADNKSVSCPFSKLTDSEFKHFNECYEVIDKEGIDVDSDEYTKAYNEINRLQALGELRILKEDVARSKENADKIREDAAKEVTKAMEKKIEVIRESIMADIDADDKILEKNLKEVEELEELLKEVERKAKESVKENNEGISERDKNDR